MLSVIMSVYNDSKYLKESIESILNQTFKEYEFIIVDDCSTDNSLEIIKEYALKDNRIKIIENNKNLGLAISLNKAWKEVTYDYIARMDADDICMLDRFEKQINYLKKNNDVDILGSNALLIDINSRECGKLIMPSSDDDIKEAIIYKNPIIHPSVIIKKEVLIQLNGYDEEFPRKQDYELWSRAIGKYRFYNIQESLLLYRANYSKSFKTIFYGLYTHSLIALRLKSLKSFVWGILVFGKSTLVKFNLYTPKTLRG